MTCNDSTTKTFSNCTAEEFYERVKLIGSDQTAEAAARAAAEAEHREAELKVECERLGWEPKHVRQWAAAITRWVRAGRPIRSDSEVARVVAICESYTDDCYSSDEQRCRECGCRLNLTGVAMFNKAKLCTETCPKKRW